MLRCDLPAAVLVLALACRTASRRCAGWTFGSDGRSHRTLEQMLDDLLCRWSTLVPAADQIVTLEAPAAVTGRFYRCVDSASAVSAVGSQLRAADSGISLMLPRRSGCRGTLDVDPQKQVYLDKREPKMTDVSHRFSTETIAKNAGFLLDRSSIFAGPGCSRWSPHPFFGHETCFPYFADARRISPRLQIRASLFAGQDLELLKKEIAV